MEQDASTEVPETICQLCEDTDTPAARYCRSCQQFMCLPCSKIHSKIYVSKDHALITSINFPDVKKNKSNSENLLAVLDCVNTPVCSPCGKSSTHYCVKLGKFVGIIPRNNGLYCNLLLTVSKEAIGTIYTVDTSSEIANTPNLELSVGRQEAQSGMFTSQCVYSNGVIYGTIPQSRSVYKLSIACIDEDKAASVLFKTFGECHGIALFDSGLAISVFVPQPCSLPFWQIQFLQMNGKIRQQVMYDAKEQPLLQEARTLATNNDKNVLFVADKKDNKIVALDTSGALLFTYNIDYPIGIALDTEENIYVGSGKKVVQIKRDRTTKRELLSAGGTVDNIWFDPSINVLAVAFGSNAVGLYKFL